MNLRDRSALKKAADESISRASYPPKNLILIHAGAALGLTMLVVLVNFLLDRFMNTTSGLGSMGLRAILSTAKSVLSIVQSVVLPFWEIGYVFTMLQVARQEQAAPSSLLTGFRRFWPVLRWLVLQGLIFFAIAMVSFYLSSQAFLMTPLSNKTAEILQPLAGQSPDLNTVPMPDPATYAALMASLRPMVILFLILYLLLAVPLMYRYRLSGYVLMDLPEKGARAALRSSRAMMRGNCLDMLKLDLSFWWYYLAQALLAVIAYGDLLLNTLGVTLPWSPDVSFLIFNLLFACGQLALYYFTRNKVELTYIHAYDTLHTPIYHRPDPVPPYQQPWQDL